MPTAQEVNTLKRQLTYAKKGKSFAWAKYYDEGRQANDTAVRYHKKLKTLTEANSGIPEHIQTELKEMMDELKKKCECPICLDVIETKDMEITNCGHKYHKECLAKITDNKCPTCRRKLKWSAD